MQSIKVGKTLSSKSVTHQISLKKDINLLWDIFSRSPIPTLIRTIKKRQNVKYNRAMYQLTGFSHSDVPDVKAWLQKLYPEKEIRKKMNDVINKSFEQKLDLKAYEAFITCKDGQRRYVEFSLYNVSVQNSPPVYQVVQALDVTERKRAVEELKLVNEKLQRYNKDLDIRINERSRELQESENRLKLALEGANEGLWEIDFKENRMTFSAKSAEMIGYQLEDLGTTSEKWDQITHTEDWPLVQQRLIDHFEGRTPFYEAEYRARTKLGEWKWILGHGQVVEWSLDNKPVKAIGTHVDITKLKETEQKLRFSENRFRSLVEHAPFGIIIINQNKRIEYFNQKFQMIFGRTEPNFGSIDEFLQKVLVEPEQLLKTQKILKQIMSETLVEPSEAQQLKICLKTGESKIVQIKIVPLNGDFLVTVEDITKVAEAYDAIKARESELEIKSSSLSEANTALRVLLKQREEDKKEFEERVLSNMKDLVSPCILKLEQTNLSTTQKTLLGILKCNLEDIVSPFAQRLRSALINLTPKEIQVANLLKEDLITKEISEILKISESSVEFHRHNIRRKLGLTRKKINLKTYLLSMKE